MPQDEGTQPMKTGSCFLRTLKMRSLLPENGVAHGDDTLCRMPHPHPLQGSAMLLSPERRADRGQWIKPSVRGEQGTFVFTEFVCFYRLQQLNR